MTEPDNRRLPNVLSKLPLLSAVPTTTALRFDGVEWRKPYSVLVEPANPAHPRAYLADEPLLIELVSRLVRELNDTGSVSRSTVYGLSDLEAGIARSHGGRGREQTLSSLNRLHNTQVFTHYRPYGEREMSSDTLISRMQLLDRSRVEISLSPLLVEDVARRQISKPPIGYFAARGLRRRIWALCLAFCGKQRPHWTMPLPEVWRRSGSVNDLRKFAYSVRTLLLADDIPGFRLALGAGRPQTLSIERLADFAAEVGTAGPPAADAGAYVEIDLGPQLHHLTELSIDWRDLFPEGK
jgi:hypothetical protein